MGLFLSEIHYELIVICVGIVLLNLVRLVWQSPSYRAGRAGWGVKLPPGPKRQFLVGNLFSFPRNRWYEAFGEYQKQYGNVPISTLPHVEWHTNGATSENR